MQVESGTTIDLIWVLIPNLTEITYNLVDSAGAWEVLVKKYHFSDLFFWCNGRRN